MGLLASAEVTSQVSRMSGMPPQVCAHSWLAWAEWCLFQQTTTWTEQGSNPQEAGLQNHKSFFLPRKSEGFFWGSLAHCHFHSRVVLVHLEHLLPDSIIQ